MKLKLIVGTIAATILCTGLLSFADEYVRGYTKKDGTYVAPYVRSDRDSSYNNNWSVKGNQNPYTGESGTKSPTWNDRTPNYNETYGNPGYNNSYGTSNGTSGYGSRSKGLYSR
jgi:hypothetical protein